MKFFGRISVGLTHVKYRNLKKNRKLNVRSSDKEAPLFHYYLLPTTLDHTNFKTPNTTCCKDSLHQ